MRQSTPKKTRSGCKWWREWLLLARLCSSRELRLLWVSPNVCVSMCGRAKKANWKSGCRSDRNWKFEKFAMPLCSQPQQEWCLWKTRESVNDASAICCCRWLNSWRKKRKIKKRVLNFHLISIFIGDFRSNATVYLFISYFIYLNDFNTMHVSSSW